MTGFKKKNKVIKYTKVSYLLSKLQTIELILLESEGAKPDWCYFSPYSQRIITNQYLKLMTSFARLTSCIFTCLLHWLFIVLPSKNAALVWRDSSFTWKHRKSSRQIWLMTTWKHIITSKLCKSVWIFMLLALYTAGQYWGGALSTGKETWV